MFHFYYGGSSLIFLLPAMLLALFAQAKVKSSFRKYSSVRNHRNMTGAEAARRVLDSNGLRDVEIRQIPGSYLTGRNLENAFYAVINDISLDRLDTLAGYVESVDAEITKKREEYGLETE